jgi:hypothetical protein
MTHDDWEDQASVDLKNAAEGYRHCLGRWSSLDGWQMAGALLLFALLPQIILRRTSQDFTEGLGAIVLSVPLLAWLFIPLRRSDDLFDEANRRRAELVDTVAIVLIWTWPWTCCVPLVAAVQSIQLLVCCGL